MNRVLKIARLVVFTSLAVLYPFSSAMANDPVVDWRFFAAYRLPGEASGLHTAPVPMPEGLQGGAEAPPYPALPHDGGTPSHRWFPQWDGLLEAPFTVELWTVDHSHYPTAVMLRGWEETGEPAFHFAYTDNGVEARSLDGILRHQTKWRSAFNRYWRHLVLSVGEDGVGEVYLNGQSLGELDWSGT